MLVAHHLIGGTTDSGDVRRADAATAESTAAASDRIDVRNAFDNALVGTIPRGTPEDVRRAAEAASASLSAGFPVHERVRVLTRAADLVEKHAPDIAQLIASEGSKTIREARLEPLRAARILRMSADVSLHLNGETLPFGVRPGSERRVGYYVRRPVGVVACILPFNDPVAVCAHKVGPALAGGNAVVVKPDNSSSLSVFRFCELLIQAGLPAGRLNYVSGHGHEIGDALVSHELVAMVSFTGGLKTGEHITRTAGVKRLALELGANSAVIVCADARLEAAASAVVDGAFAQAGQNCLGVQRVFVHRSVYDAFSSLLVDKVRALKSGHSLDEQVDVCQMIRLAEAERVEAWIREAVEGGARVLAGGARHGSVVEPTVLEGVADDARLSCQEVYGPVVGLTPFDDLQDAVARANNVEFGLHGAVFTENLRDAFYVAEHLEVGAVIVNDSTDYRLDTMPFGGVKKSGVGREGIRFAAEEMTVTRVVCLNL